MISVTYADHTIESPGDSVGTLGLIILTATAKAMGSYTVGLK